MTPNETIALPGDRVGIIIRRRSGDVHVAVVDAADYPLVAGYRWCVGKNGYAFARVATGRMITMHRELMGHPTSMQVDHIDGCRLNNFRSNLRLANNQQNTWNTGARVNNTSGYKGVSWDGRRSKWRARITISGKEIWIGYFGTAGEAHTAYLKSATEQHGEFLNRSDR